MNAPCASDALRDALNSLPIAAYSLDPDVLSALRENVCAVVDELKAAGTSPEHVMLAVKAIAIEARLGLAGARLIETMTHWCITHYFAPAGEILGGGDSQH